MKLLRTPRIDALLRSVEHQGGASGEQLGKAWISHSSLIQLSKTYGVPLRKLVTGTAVYHDPPPAPEKKDPSYLAMMQQLRAEQQEREYQALLASTSPPSRLITEVSLDSNDRKVIKEQVTTIVNILVSIVAVALAVWTWASSWPLGSRTLLSLMAAAGTGLAEVVVYNGYLNRVEEARRVESRRKERRTVVETFEFSGVISQAKNLEKTAKLKQD